MVEFLKGVIAPFYSAVHTLPKIATAPSYYPELPRKGLFRRYSELVWSRFVTRSTNLFYNAYGMDCKCFIGSKGYISEREFWSRIIALNYPNNVNHAVILRDKYLFFVFMKAHGIPTPEVIGCCNAGHFYRGNIEVSYSDWERFLKEQEGNLFVKEAGSCCAQGVVKIAREKWNLTEQYFGTAKYIVQREIYNCKEINIVQPNSVNTLRIVTAISSKSGKIELVSPGGLRIGGGADVDNWATGGLFVGIDAQGRLQQYGYYKPGKHVPCKSACQPQTGFAFIGSQIPYYRQAVDLVKKAHSLLPEVVSIGWDVALTDDGPMIIEGNDDYEISLMQMVAGGLRERFVELGLLR